MGSAQLETLVLKIMRDVEDVTRSSNIMAHEIVKLVEKNSDPNHSAESSFRDPKFKSVIVNHY